jgi:hypothetical protein
VILLPSLDAAGSIAAGNIAAGSIAGGDFF